MNQNSSSRFTPILLALCLVAGILIGTFYANHFSGNRLNIINTNSNKVNDLLRIIDDQYVDTVNMTELVEQAMPRILAELDPHSGYLRAKEAEGHRHRSFHLETADRVPAQPGQRRYGGKPERKFLRYRGIIHQTKRYGTYHQCH